MKYALLIALLAVAVLASCAEDSQKEIAELRERAEELEGKQKPTEPLNSQEKVTKDDLFVNSLGMEFIPVPGTSGILMCRTETRVQDFRVYVKESGYSQRGGAFVLTREGPDMNPSASWEGPGFQQGADHPVTCVSWEEANAFCAWLTKRDRDEGLIGAADRYRLPKDAEWSAAVGSSKYPWGDRYPPSSGAGNYAGSEADTGSWPDDWGTIPGYHDLHPRTGPVESYAANRFGFCDLGGNVLEWCEDRYGVSMNDADLLEQYDFLKKEVDDGGTPYRVVRGGSWNDRSEGYLRSSFRLIGPPAARLGGLGFRVVVVMGGGG